jgi:hypothetical protein
MKQNKLGLRENISVSIFYDKANLQATKIATGCSNQPTDRLVCFSTRWSIVHLAAPNIIDGACCFSHELAGGAMEAAGS